ncbi:ATPase family AAA domain-containing protein 3-B-like [Oscarella lobularis]|uniref:ATPase family AAA domain-containing protein 3-B-like n=1 Tax=Oscarella lobularis TaxID=121494 RepID=UPI0033134BA0
MSGLDLSWLFGKNARDVPPLPTGTGAPPSPPNPPGRKPGDEEKPKEKWTGFDPSGLERAAKAVKELEKSNYAKDALELAKQQELTTQLESQKNIKEWEATVEKIKYEQVQKEHEEKRKTLSAETQEHQRRAQYEDRLARKRYDDQLNQQRQVNEANLRRQEESVQKQEAIRRKTVEYEAELRHGNEMKRLQAELSGKAKIERENRDINLEKIRVDASEKRETILKSLEKAGTIIGNGFVDFVTDWNKVSATAAGITVIAIGFYAAKTGVSVLGRFVEARLGKPSLVRSTSRLNFWSALWHPIQSSSRIFAKPENVMKGIVLEPSLDRHLMQIATATRNSKQKSGLLRNVLLYGPPGTGKTLFAKSLANHSGLEYAIMTGGDVAPLGRDGVTAIHKLFDWASTSRRGVLLFVDEADAFLKPRKDVVSEEMRSALNAFLYRTGELSRKFMLVLATNQPHQLDFAVSDRLDEIVRFDLPGREERLKILSLYVDRYILNPVTSMWFIGRRRKIGFGNFNLEEKIGDIADKSVGLSGRELAKLVIAWQSAAFASANGLVTEEDVDACFGRTLEQHGQKVEWSLSK